MTGFEPQTSGIGRDRSANWDTTTAWADMGHQWWNMQCEAALANPWWSSVKLHWQILDEAVLGSKWEIMIRQTFKCFEDFRTKISSILEAD